MKTIASIAFVLLVLASACATMPETQSERDELTASARATLDAMKAKDPGLDVVLAGAAGYVVFPAIGKGGLIAGGAHGTGVVFQRGRAVGFAELNQASIGAQLGGQTFAELLVFWDPGKLEQLKQGRFSLGADASAVALSAGAASAARFDDGVGVFIMPRGGLMVDLSVNGQLIDFQPRG